MAERRMFAKKIIDSDAFLDMPLSTQALYFHLSMRADDEGFINNPRKIQRMIGNSDDDMKLLIAKRFLLAFDSGVVVVKHWKIHNYIQKDRFQPTLYNEEKSMIEVDGNKSYTFCKHDVYIADTRTETLIEQPFEPCIQDVYNPDTQVRLGKVSKGKERIVEVVEKPAATRGGIIQSFEAFQKLYQFPNEYQRQDISYLIEEYSDEFVAEALHIAGTKDVSKGKAINFITAVLKEWEQNHVDTIDKIKIYQGARQTKTSYQSGYSKPAKKEVEPAWMNKTITKKVKPAEPVKPEVSEEEMEARLQAYLNRKEEQS